MTGTVKSTFPLQKECLRALLPDRSLSPRGTVSTRKVHSKDVKATISRAEIVFMKEHSSSSSSDLVIRSVFEVFR